jgi:adenylyltransferase/sulfurtransferase
LKKKRRYEEESMNNDQLLRYSRHILLPQVDIQGQEQLLKSSVLICGLGGLGSPVAIYLAAAGVGHLVLADDDRVELSNLQRQIIHATKAQGQLKTESAAATLKALNPDTRLELVSERLSGELLMSRVAKTDLVVDATDNLTSRFELNRACVRHGKPMIFGAAVGLNGQLAVFDQRHSDQPCFQCLYPEQPDPENSCATSGVLASIVGVIGALQATEALKLLCGIGDSPSGRVMLYDGENLSWKTLKLSRDPGCPVCAQQAANP